MAVENSTHMLLSSASMSITFNAFWILWILAEWSREDWLRVRIHSCAAFVHSLKAAFSVLLELGQALDDYVFIMENEVIKGKPYTYFFIHHPGTWTMDIPNNHSQENAHFRLFGFVNQPYPYPINVLRESWLVQFNVPAVVSLWL